MDEEKQNASSGNTMVTLLREGLKGCAERRGEGVRSVQTLQSKRQYQQAPWLARTLTTEPLCSPLASGCALHRATDLTSRWPVAAKGKAGPAASPLYWQAPQTPSSPLAPPMQSLQPMSPTSSRAHEPSRGPQGKSRKSLHSPSVSRGSTSQERNCIACAVRPRRFFGH